MKLSIILGIASLTLAATAADARVVKFSGGSFSFTGYGTRLPTGEKLITNFGNSAASNLSGNGSFFTGSHSNAAAPALTRSTQDTKQYLGLQKGQSETITFAATENVSIYVGSLDSYNTIAFSNGDSFGGRALANGSGAVDDGDQRASDANGRFIFHFNAPVDSVTLSSSGSAFEVADVAAGVPEPATWAMLILGLCAVGVAMRQRKVALTGSPA